jgi:hypothetical protein
MRSIARLLMHKNVWDEAKSGGSSYQMSENAVKRDPLYVFACHLEWRMRRNVAAYQELLAALDDGDPDVRCVAEVLLDQSSPKRESAESTVFEASKSDLRE